MGPKARQWRSRDACDLCGRLVRVEALTRVSYEERFDAVGPQGLVCSTCIEDLPPTVEVGPIVLFLIGHPY